MALHSRTEDNPVALRTDAVFMGDVSSTVKYATIDIATSGDNTIVSGVSSKSIKVLSYIFGGATATTVRFKSAASTDLSGAMQVVVTSGVVWSAQSPVGLFVTNVGEALVINLSGSNQISGHLTYVEV